MKTKGLWLLAMGCLLLMSACSKYKYEEVKGDLMKTRIYTLDNGLKVYLSVNKEKPRIQTYIAVRTGSKNDPAETTGLAHYLEHLMFKGTDKFGVTDAKAEAPLLADIEQRYEKYRKLTDAEARRKAYHEIDSVSQLAAQYFIPNEYDKLMSTIGAEGTNAYTSNDVTCYTENIPSNQVDNWAKIQGERFQNMVIRGFHTELEAVYEEYNISLTRDGRKLFAAMNAKLFPGHPYGTQTTLGSQEHLKNPSITNIKNYFSHWYVPNNVAICMAGDFDPDKVIATIDKYFGQWKSGDDVEQPDFGELPALTEPQDTTVVGPEAESLWLGWRFDGAASLQTDTLEVVENMLSNGTAGLLDLDITQQMKMLNAWGGVQSMTDHSMFLLGGTPKQGQTLEEARELLLAEVEKLKQGDFSDDLLPSVVNNMKLRFYNQIEDNESRADMFVEAFISGTPWQQVVGSLSRIEGMTKEQIVSFVQRHFHQGYACVYKRQGVDASQKKIDKPAITPIPTNRDTVSLFVKDIQDTKVKTIEPSFVDFQRDLTFGETSAKLPYIYVENRENGRFQLAYRYELGREADPRYASAASYIDFVGTDSLSPAQVQQQFYRMACNYYINVGDRQTTVYLYGLSENMPEALRLLEHVMTHAKADSATYEEFIKRREKERTDAKLNQQTNFSYLVQYGLYGPQNSYREQLSPEQLRQTDPQQLLDVLKHLSQYQHTVLYYGPMKASKMAQAVTDAHPTATALMPAPETKHYALQPTPVNEVLLAPYDAKNIYMRMYHNEQRPWHPGEMAVQTLFNEYYGGAMNSIVFQELREARGLAYNAWASYEQPYYKDQPEYYMTHIITQNDKMMDCIHQFRAILDSVPQSQAAFDVARDAVMKRIASQRTTKFELISAWLSAKTRGIDYDINERIYQALPSLTLADIVGFEQQQMANKTYRYIILGDEKELDIKSLEKFGTIRRITTEELFGY